MHARPTLRRAAVGLGLGLVTGAVAALVIPRRPVPAMLTTSADASTVLTSSDDGDK